MNEHKNRDEKNKNKDLKHASSGNTTTIRKETEKAQEDKIDKIENEEDRSW